MGTEEPADHKENANCLQGVESDEEPEIGVWVVLVKEKEKGSERTKKGPSREAQVAR
jgi:hypothetical protein